MSTFDYLKSATTALTLIEKFGATAKITHTEVSEPVNPWDPSTGEVVTKEYEAAAVVTDYAQRLIDGVTVKYGDKEIIVAASGLDIMPSANDVIETAGQKFSIVSVNVVSPAGVPLVYRVQARI